MQCSICLFRFGVVQLGWRCALLGLRWICLWIGLYHLQRFAAVKRLAQTDRSSNWSLLNVRAHAMLNVAELVLGVRCLIPAQSHRSLTDITHEAIVKHGMHALSDCPRCLLFAFNVSLACLDSVVSCSFGAVPFLMSSASVFLSDSTTCKGSFQSQLGADRSIQIVVTARCQCTCNARRCRAGIRRAMPDTSSIASHSHKHYT